MGVYLNPSSEPYRAVSKSPYFVDKTKMLEKINSFLNAFERDLCVSHPKGFGKTTDAQMLAAYYGCGENTGDLFQNLDIAASRGYEMHRNQYHVIYLDMLALCNRLEKLQKSQTQNPPAEGEQDFRKWDVVDFLCAQVTAELKEAFPTANIREVPFAETFLQIHRSQEDQPKFIFIVDDWDILFRRYLEDKNLLKHYVELLLALYEGPSRCCISLVYLTGIFPVKGSGVQAELVGFHEHSMMSLGYLPDYAGISDAAVQRLCRKYGADPDYMKQWYGGYSYIGHDDRYSPQAICQAFSEKLLTSRFSDKEAEQELRTWLDSGMVGLRDALNELLDGGTLEVVTIEIVPHWGAKDFFIATNTDEALTILIHRGYLTCYCDGHSQNTTVFIPNLDVRESLRAAIGDR